MYKIYNLYIFYKKLRKNNKQNYLSTGHFLFCDTIIMYTNVTITVAIKKCNAFYKQ